MKRFWSNLSVVSGTTILSRILGLLRDSLFFSIFGASVIGEAFLLAFTFPNLFRRMLGEGTLNSAFVPIFTETREKKGEQRAWNLLNQVISRLLVWLGGFALFVCVLSWGFGWVVITETPKWALAAQVNGITFAYVVLICSSAILVGAQNVFGRFLEGALSPVVLNTFMISALLLATLLGWNDLETNVLLLGLAVVAAGCIQLLLPWMKLKRDHGWSWSMNMKSSEELGRVRRLFWIGAFGAAVAQLNVLISRFLAFVIDDSGSLSYLYMSARLVELPLGVFAIAISTILFPTLARASAKENLSEFNQAFFLGLKTIGAITLPASVGLYFLAEPIIRLLFEWNAFGPDETLEAAGVLAIVTWTIPMYAISSFLVKALHARKNMKIPFQAAVVSLSLNLVLSLTLMHGYGVFGLAWANLISAIGQTVYLAWKSENLCLGNWWDSSRIYLQASLIGCLGMAVILHVALPALPDEGGKWGACFILSIFVPLGALVFLSILRALGFSWSLSVSRDEKS